MAANRTFLGSVHNNQPEQLELPASTTITPGMVLLRTNTQLKPHDGANLGGFVYVAKELTAGGTVDDNYTVGQTCQAYIPKSGDMFQMLVATGQNLDVDTPLTSTGAGLLDIASGTDVVICYSDEDVTTSATTKVRVKFK